MWATLAASAASAVLPTPASPAKVVGVAFTGANILRWVIIAAVLMAVGSLLVVVNRRRRVNVAA